MKSISFFITACFLLFTSSGNAQTVNGQLKSTGDAQLHVIRLFADSFPQVSLTFYAEIDSGAAVWNLQKRDVRVEENEQRGKITSFRLLSAEQHLQTMVVIDHSGSMKKDRRYWEWFNAIDWDTIPFTDTIRHYCRSRYIPASTYAPIQTRNYDGEVSVSGPAVPCDMRDTFYLVKRMPEWPGRTPLWYAQQGAKVFIKTMNVPEDTTGLIGFSDFPDVYIPHAQNSENTFSQIDAMRPDGATAFYDAVDQSLNHLVYHRGLRAIVALTDGRDNSSRMSLVNLIAKAKKMRCPVYVIGLGDVDQVALEQLSSETGGELYLTNDATKLEEVFLKISRRLQAVYEVVYESPFLKSSEPTHALQLHFDVDSMFLNSQVIDLPLPESVITHLKKREAQQMAFQQNFPIIDSTTIANEEILVENTETILPGIKTDAADQNEFPYETLGVTFLAAGAGALIYKKVKRDAKKLVQLKIVNVFPNPSSGPVTINYFADAELVTLRLTIANSEGKEIYAQEAESTLQSIEIDLSQEAPGIYFVQMQSASGVSEVRKLILQR